MPERKPAINRKAARHHRTKMEVPFVTNFNIAEEFDPAWLDSKPDLGADLSVQTHEEPRFQR